MTQPTEIERCALTILAQADPYHPTVKAWALALVADLSETRSLREYVADPAALDPEFRAVLVRNGVTLAPYELTDYTLSESPGYRLGNDAHTEARHTAYMLQDAALSQLAGAVVAYRREHRPEGSYVAATLYTVGEIHTSLAAAIAEYVSAVRDVTWTLYREVTTAE